MTKATTIRDRAGPEVKGVFGKFFRSVAETSGVIVHVLGVMLYRWVLYPRRIPNQEALDALREVRERKDLPKHTSLEDFEKDLDRA